jgi:putative transposase
VEGNNPRRNTRRRLQGFDYSDPGHVFFVTTCARAGTAPFVDERLARIVVDALQWLRNERCVHLYAYCLMPDHLHVLLQPGSSGEALGALMGSVKRFTTRESWKIGYEGQLWQGRFYDRVMRTTEDGHEMARYIVANPVRKGLCGEADSYPWSGMPDTMG